MRAPRPPGRHGVPLWGLVSAALAPVLLIGGWSLAASVQPRGFDSVRDTISQLAAVGMPHRWVMSAALAGLGLCHVVTAAALRPAAVAGRSVLAVGGAATLLVAANPLPAGGGGSQAHTAAATVAFVALSLWPALARRRHPAEDSDRSDASWQGALGAGPRLVAAVFLTALLLWFFATLRSGSTDVGLSERATAGAQAVWPLAVVLSLRRRDSTLRGRQA